MKKLVSLLLVVFLCLPMTTGLAEKLSETNEVITIGLYQNSLVGDFDTNDFTLWVEEQTGIDIEFVLFPAVDATQKLEIMINGGSELPDIISGFYLSHQAVYNYGSNEYFIDLTPYFEGGKATNFYAQMERAEASGEHELSAEEVLAAVRSLDGNIYSYPTYNAEYANCYRHRWYIESNWLEAVGKEVPNTIDELYDVLVAFRDGDPNGNGIKDEIPMMGCSVNQATIDDMILNSFVEWDPLTYRAVENGVVYAPFILDAYRDGLRFMNKLVEEGLLSAESYTLDRPQYKTYTDLPIGEDTIVGIWAGAPSQSFDNNVNYVRRNQYVGFLPVEGPDGVRNVPYSSPTVNHAAHITTDCDNPDLAFALLDFFWSEDALIRARFGVEGVHWRRAEEGELSNGQTFGYSTVPASIYVIESVWNTKTNSMWMNRQPNQNAGWLMDGEVGSFDEKNALPMIYTLLAKMPAYANDEYVSLFLKYGEEDQAEQAELNNAIRGYVDESMVRFIVGDLDIDDDKVWEDYKKTLDSMNLDRWIELTQIAQDNLK